jgi:hypothetical protein
VCSLINKTFFCKSVDRVSMMDVLFRPCIKMFYPNMHKTVDCSGGDCSCGGVRV